MGPSVRAAVIGGGVFGVTAAVDLARAGATVDLYEARLDVLEGATARNQARLHSGYHYPRSDATAAACRDAAPEFAARYREAIRTYTHHYVVAEESKVSGDEYLAFCDRLGLLYEVVEPAKVHGAQVTVRVPEAFVDTTVLRRLLRRDLRKAGVTVHYGRRVEPEEMRAYDLTVVATYGQPWSRPLRYEVVEVALLSLARYDGQSFVVMDGEHVSLDPHGVVHTLYDVKHSVHASNVGYAPHVPDKYRGLIASLGPVRNSPLTHVQDMIASGGRHLGLLDPSGGGVSIYSGSWFSVRAVLPDVDATDARPTLVERDGNVVSILSGKICTAVTAARSIVEPLGVPA